MDLTLHYSLDRTLPDLSQTPHRIPSGQEPIDRFWPLFQRNAVLTRLGRAVTIKTPNDIGQELEDLIAELYDWLFDNRHTLSLVESVARDFPELNTLYFREFRKNGLAVWAKYLKMRAHAGFLVPMPDYDAAARLLLETATAFAVARHLDIDHKPFPDDIAKTTVLRTLTHAFIPAGWY
ncbi:MAG: TetR/AcrR family transcriptional regulator C-terminal domain-containing protein [Gemmatimonadota bacterium]|nr:TetR/AcrR family transcriptional regulator C-terminal domain-containing protein [Gemmatimonadota bacterium]